MKKNNILNICKPIHLFVLMLVLLLNFACSDFLEQPEQTGLTPEVVFSDLNSAEQVLAAGYALMPTGIVNTENGPWSFRIQCYTGTLSNMSDESDTYSLDAAPGCVDRIYQKGGLDATTIMAYTEAKWVWDYLAIRNCNLYLANIDKVTKNTTPELIAQRKAEAKILLAIKYFELFKRYGGVAWVPGLVKLNDESAYMPRLTVEQTVNKIINYLDEAIAEPNLPMVSADKDFGRANKAAAYFLKARTLMFAASPLFNKEVFPLYGQQELVRYKDISDGAIQSRWERAKTAALQAVTELNNAGYRIIGEVGGVVDKELADNKNGVNFKKSCDWLTYPSAGNTEIVFPVRGERNGTLNGPDFWAPPQTWTTTRSGNSLLRPLQNIVDQFELTSGEMQSDNQYSSSTPYDDIEARFKQSVLYHGSVIDKDVNPTRVVDFVETGNAATSGANYPRAAQNHTGYSQRKFLTDRHLVLLGEVANVFWPYMRLADLYLILAETANESGDIETALTWINKVRNRGGQPDLQTTTRWNSSAKNKEYMRLCIIRERTAELLFENQRYFDLKRRLMGYEDVNYKGPGKGSIGGQMYRIKVTGSAASPSFAKVPFETRTFSDKFYFYPFPQDDINKSGGIIVQNPGW